MDPHPPSMPSGDVDDHGEARYPRNAVRCLACGATVESTHVHDFRPCPCGAVTVDGGPDYLRRAYRPGARWQEDSVERIDDGTLRQINSEGPVRRDAGEEGT